MSIERYYTQSIPIQRKGAVTRSGLNATVQSYAAYITVMGCIRPMSAREQEASKRDNVFSTHIMYCASAAIQAEDRPAYGGVTYQVTYVRDPMSMGQHLEIELKVVQS